MSETTPSPTPPSPRPKWRLSLDTWAVLLAAALTLLVVLRAIPRVPW